MCEYIRLSIFSNESGHILFPGRNSSNSKAPRPPLINIAACRSLMFMYNIIPTMIIILTIRTVVSISNLPDGSTLLIGFAWQ